MMEDLFSYGTLQEEPVQLATFGRKLSGTPDVLAGYRTELIRIEDESVIAKSGKTHHPIVIYTGEAGDTVEGTVYAITHEEMLQADEYEVDDYKRIRVSLQSGSSAWVYVTAH
ncbi:MAG TPA: gamma-glutamylcyclotransferase family protein [Puia sp.]|nr:gamma-glutamylcyclotransferase family protein [Puia sp.]